MSLNNKVPVSNLRENSFKPSMFLQNRISNLKNAVNIATRAGGKFTKDLDTVDKVLEQNY